MAPCCCLVKSWAGFSLTQLNKSGLLQHTAAWHSPGMGILWGRWAWRGGSNSPLWERVEREANNKSDRVTEYTARRVVAVEDKPQGTFDQLQPSHLSMPDTLDQATTKVCLRSLQQHPSQTPCSSLQPLHTSPTVASALPHGDLSVPQKSSTLHLRSEHFTVCLLCLTRNYSKAVRTRSTLLKLGRAHKTFFS